jgi:hypothetical protein
MNHDSEQILGQGAMKPLMTNSELEQQSAKQHRRVTIKNGRLRIELSPDLSRIALADFSQAAQTYAMNLSEDLYRKFAFRYIGYLQEIAHGLEPSKPHAIHDLPACTLIRAELERLFRSHFLRLDEVAA